MVETEHTPNPNTLKFLPGKKVSEVGPIEFLKNDKIIKVSLANKILSFEGTVMVFFGEDFITVKKEKDLNWKDMKHGIISEINDYYSKGNEVVVGKDLINQKIKKAKTDNDPIPSEINGLKNRHEAANLISIYASVNNINVSEVLKEFSGKNFSTFKSKLSESIIEKICPIGTEIKKLLKDKNHLDTILKIGSKRADLIAKNNLKEVYEVIGLTKFT